MADERPAVSVVVPCWYKEDQIESCIYTSVNQESSKGGFEFILAEGMASVR